MNNTKQSFLDLLKTYKDDVFLHISTDVTKDGTFTPRIPLHIADGEENTTNRICVSPTLEGCLMAFPDCNMSWYNFLCNTMGYIKVFVIIPSKLGILNTSIIDNKTLYEKGLVPDANTTMEHWILESFEVPSEDQFILLIDKIEEGENHYPVPTICDPVLENEKEIQFGCIDVDLMTAKIKELFPNINQFRFSGHDITGMFATFPKGSDLSELFYFHRTQGYPPEHLCDYNW